MANKLRRVAAVRATPGKPAVPGSPAYCTIEPVFSDFGQYASQLNLMVNLTQAMYKANIGASYWDSSGKIGQVSIPPSLNAMFGFAYGEANIWYYEKKCFPATKGTPAVPAKVTYEKLTGWDSGAISVGGFMVNGYLEFTIGPANVGTVIGLSTGPDTLSPMDASHAFHSSGQNLHVFEGGAQVMAVPGGLAGSPRLRIERRNGTVSYWVNGDLIYTSAKKSAGYARIDASLYAVGDYIDDPLIGAVMSGKASGAIGITAGISVRPRGTGRIGISGSARGRAGSKYYSTAAGAIGLSGSAAGSAQNFSAGQGDIGITGEAVVASNVCRGTMPRFVGNSGKANYAASAGRYQGAPEGYSYGGFPDIGVGMAIGYVPAPVGFSMCLSGGVLSSAGTGPAAVGVSADRDYSASAGVYRGRYKGVSYEPWLSADAVYMPEFLLLAGEFQLFAEVRASFKSVINIGSGWVIDLEIEQGLHWLDAILVSSSASELSDRLMAFGSTLMFTNSADPSGSRSAQMVTNVQTGAVSQYSGFDFIASNKIGGVTYLLCADGVYTLGRGGEVMPMAADLGGSDFGTSQGKIFDSIYIAGDTDGQLTVTLQADKGVAYSRPAVGRASVLRAKTAKGVKGRTWRIQLEIEGAEFAEIESVEPVIGTSGRRL